MISGGKKSKLYNDIIIRQFAAQAIYWAIQ